MFSDLSGGRSFHPSVTYIRLSTTRFQSQFSALCLEIKFFPGNTKYSPLKIFGKHHTSSNPTCPVITGYDTPGVPIAGGLTLQRIMLIAAGACTAITLLVSLSLIFKHLQQYTVPDEQRQIIRIIFTPVIFAILNLLSIAFYHASVYLTPIADLYEAFALASFFLLLVCYVAPGNATQQENVFADFGSLGWFKYTWIPVLLYCVVKTILVVAQEASQATGTYSNTSNNIHFGHLWISIINSVAIVIAVLSILRFYRRFKKDIAHHKPLAKLISFKLIVFTNFVQTLAFSFLNSGGHLTGNSHVTHLEIWLGIPSLLACFEQVGFSLFFHYSYRAQEYCSSKASTPRLSLFAATTNALNPADLISGIFRAFGYLVTALGRSRAYNDPPEPTNGVGSPPTEYGTAPTGHKYPLLEYRSQ